MFKRTCLVVLAAAMFLGSSCPPQQGVSDNPDNTLVPRPWSEAFGNKRNTSFNAVHTQLALPPFIKWTAPVGKFPTGPAVGPDGVIWVGNQNGELVGINPDGTEHLRRKLDDQIDSAPAVNPDTNEIFVRGNQLDASLAAVASKLYRLDANVGLHAVSSADMLSFSAPKLWGGFVFLTVQRPAYQLYVFDQSTLNLFAHVDADVCFNILCAGFDPIPILFQFSSVAIIDQAAVVQDPSKPIVIATAGRSISAWRFDPSAAEPLTLLWCKTLVPVDCEPESVISGSPVIMADGTVVFAFNGNVRALDPLTGDTLWTHDVGRFAGTMATAGLRQVYVVANRQMITLDSNGTEMDRQPVEGVNASAAVSLDFVYVVTTSGLYTFGLTSDQGLAFDPSTAGFTAPDLAIAEDSTIYVSSGPTRTSGALTAYSPSGTLFRALAFPTLTWQTPADGSTITSAPGRTLAAAVSSTGGSSFQGTVTFSSDLDGTLCENIVPTNGVVSCTTSMPLTIGTHTLTALAEDPSGGADTAAITVNVVDTPPTVAIASPAANAVFQQGASITFTADVTDPDQASFAPDTIQWQSSIDGTIGTGLSFAKSLSLGTHTITATATDAAGVIGSASLTTQVTQGPIVTIQQPKETDQFNEITDITFTATVLDSAEPDFPAGNVKWTSDRDGDLGTGLSIIHRLSIGTHTVTVTATDSHGLTGTATVRLVIFAS